MPLIYYKQQPERTPDCASQVLVNAVTGKVESPVPSGLVPESPQPGFTSSLPVSKGAGQRDSIFLILRLPERQKEAVPKQVF